MAVSKIRVRDGAQLWSKERDAPRSGIFDLEEELARDIAAALGAPANPGQALVCRTMRPVLESLAVESHTITRHDELEFIVDRSIKQAVATQAAVAFILSPLLTGGNVFEA